MPPHCDSMDGPGVTTAKTALASSNVELLLPFVPAEGAAEVTRAFEEAVAVRGQSAELTEFADRWFFENVVRVHRAGKDAPCPGLKPAGLGERPVIPVAERALETGSADELIGALSDIISEQVRHRLDHAMELRTHAEAGVRHAGEYVGGRAS